MNSRTEPAEKKVYQKPTLTRYGNLAEMTKANTMAGSKDGGPNNTKTSL
jgi:hypothetical protein